MSSQTDDSPAAAARFLFVTCQVGAEGALKAEFARRWPDLRPAYARPGFVTFKLPDGDPPPHAFQAAIFARACSQTLGKIEAKGRLPHELVAEVWQLAGPRAYQGLHVWHRDAAPPGEHGYEPGLTPADTQIAGMIRAGRPGAQLPGWVHPGAVVLDCLVVEPDLWWVGWHEAQSLPSCWPGGFCKIELPADAVSRTYLKMEEALRWAQFPMLPGHLWAEIGAAPGGASQALLGRGQRVLGIDPAEIHPSVLAHPNFTHVRKRGHEVRRKVFRKVKWLAADMNVAPSYTLDTVEAIVTHPQVNIRGLLLTLKILDWELTRQIPEYLFRVRSWGYKEIRARQLHHDRREFCLAARQRVEK